MKVCFDINHTEYFALKEIAQMHNRSPVEHAKAVLLDVIHARGDCSQGQCTERRAYKRFELSISAVSCVSYPDRVVRSIPVTVDDISQGGMRITFNGVESEEARRLADVSYFEVVFTIPETYQTVSFYCKRRWSNHEHGVSMGGGFESVDASLLEMLSKHIGSEKSM